MTDQQLPSNIPFEKTESKASIIRKAKKQQPIDNSKEIEEKTRLSQSKLWDLQRNYFQTMGIEAWEHDVPFYITNNAFIGHQYAYMVTQMLRDLKSTLKPNTVVYIMELGCGTGKFGFYFLKSLLTLMQSLQLNTPICYIMSDVSEKNINFCRENSCLKPFVEQGVLDFAIFDAEKDTDFTLLNANRSFSALEEAPLIVIANYIFDCLKQDYLKLQENKYQGMSLALNSRYKSFDQESVRYMNELRLNISFDEIDLNDYFPDKNLVTALNELKADLIDKTAWMPIPLAALQFFHNMNRLCHGKVLFIMGDKGISDPNMYARLTDKYLSTFEGCYTFLVNFYLMAEYIKKHQGSALLSEKNNEFLVNLYSFGYDLESFANTKLAFNQQLEHLGPHEYASLYDQAIQNAYRFSPKAITAFLRLSHWDPDAYAVIHDRLMDIVSTLAPHEARNLEIDLQKIEQNVYALPIGNNVNNLLGLFYEKTNNRAKAMMFFERAMTVFEKSEEPYHNLAIMYEKEKEVEKAFNFYKKAYALNKHDTFAKRRMNFLHGNPLYSIALPLFRFCVVVAGIGLVLYILTR